MIEIKLENSLEAKLTRSYFRHIVRRQDPVDKAIALGKQKTAGKEEDQI